MSEKLIRCENCGEVGPNNNEYGGMLAIDGFSMCCGSAWTVVKDFREEREAHDQEMQDDTRRDVLAFERSMERDSLLSTMEVVTSPEDWGY